MTLSSLFIDSDTYWKISSSLVMLMIATITWAFRAKSVLVRGIFTLITIVAGLFLIGIIYHVKTKMIVYDVQETIDIVREQPANINGAVLTERKKTGNISASSQWLNAVDEKLPELVGKLDNETEKRDLTFCVKQSKQDLSNVTSIVGAGAGADDDNRILLDNLLITCLKDKGYKFKSLPPSPKISDVARSLLPI